MDSTNLAAAANITHDEDKTMMMTPILGRRRHHHVVLGSLCILFVSSTVILFHSTTTLLSRSLQYHSSTSSTSSFSPPSSSSSSSSSLEEVQEVAAAVPTTTTRLEEEDDFSQALRDFTTLLHDDPEQYALRPWTWRKPEQEQHSSSSTSNQSIHFDGLSLPLLQDAFGKKRILLLGDSTLYYFENLLQRLLAETPIDTINSLPTLNLTQANQLLNLTTHAKTPPIYHAKKKSDSSSPARSPSVWKGYRGPAGPGSCEMQNMWNATIQKMRPRVVVVNMGLHWMHLVTGSGVAAAGSNASGHNAFRNEPLCFAQMVTHYEAWLQDIVHMARLAGTKLLLFKTTNFICNNLYRDQYATNANMFQQERQLLDLEHGQNNNNTNVFHGCMNYFIQQQQQQKSQQQKQRGLSLKYQQELSNESIYKYCNTATLDEAGATHLNQRLADFVALQQQQQQSSGNDDSLKIRIFNDHDLQSCQYSKVTDGRHYHALNLMRIRVLANTIQHELVSK